MKKVKMKTFAKIFLCFLCPAAISGTSYSRSQIRFDAQTGGYSDIGVIVSDELKKSECPQILDHIKVGISRE